MSKAEREGAAALAMDLYCLWCERHDNGRGRGFDELLRQWPQYEHELRRLHDANPLASKDSTVVHLNEVGTATGKQPPDAATAAVAALRAVQNSRSRYRIDGVLGRGGAGIVLRVVDRALGRELAMKMLRAEYESKDGRGENRQGLRRLIDEAEVLGKLEHPSIVPVHELGLDEHGRVYFTMPRIEGLPLSEVIARCTAGERNWSRERVLEVLLKVCDALAYAHQRGVLHRDLKPANVMVGTFGQVYVVDWGLARAHESGSDDESGEPEDAGLTLTGDVLGTPSYISPEQARGLAGTIDAGTDVYAIGAMLYELLAGRAPYDDIVPSRKTAEILSAVRAGPPTDLGRLAPNASSELIAIARKAMARDLDRRYPSATALAEDLRAFMEGRVVAAHAHGAWAQLRKWVKRNRALASTLCVLLLVAAFGASLLIASEHVRAREAREQSDARASAALREREQELWPAEPRNLPAMLAWLEESSDLVSRIPYYRAQLDKLRSRSGLAQRGDGTTPALTQPLIERMAGLHAEIGGLQQDFEDIRAHAAGPGLEQGLEFVRGEQRRREHTIARLQSIVDEEGGWQFADGPAGKRCTELWNTLFDALELADPADGGVVRMQARIDSVSKIAARSLKAPQAAWRAAVASIANVKECPAYGGLRLTAQFGLAPLGRDPKSGLWEFVDVATGEIPERDAAGDLRLSSEHGVVFVLLPPGEIELGNDSSIPVPQVKATVRLDAFFLAKHELTQAQWFRMTGENPSYYRVGTFWALGPESLPPDGGVITVTWSSPVEQVNWQQCKQALGRFGFALPTEAQWEYGCRAGTTTPWSFGTSYADLVGKVNAAHGGTSPLPFDGWHINCPIGTFPQNPWGLHEMHGNVSEWTLEPFWTSFRFPLRDGDGLMQAPESRLRTARGGNCGADPGGLRSGARMELSAAFCDRSFGVRPMRKISLVSSD